MTSNHWSKYHVLRWFKRSPHRQLDLNTAKRWEPHDVRVIVTWSISKAKRDEVKRILLASVVKA